jgi:lysozyme family protein
MADFKTAFDITNGNEGGWQNDPHDTGNDTAGRGTYKGIASAKQPKWNGWGAIKAAIEKMAPQPQYGTGPYRGWVRQLNAILAADGELQQKVESFYRENFWDSNRLGELSSQPLANKVYDCGVNQGTGTAAKILQGCLGVTVDGCIGAITIAAANGRDGAGFAASFRAARAAKYRELVKEHPQYAQYLDGWLARC